MQSHHTVTQVVSDKWKEVLFIRTSCMMLDKSNYQNYHLLCLLFYTDSLIHKQYGILRQLVNIYKNIKNEGSPCMSRVITIK